MSCFLLHPLAEAFPGEFFDLGFVQLVSVHDDQVPVLGTTLLLAKALVPPFGISFFADPAGSFTTAAAPQPTPVRITRPVLRGNRTPRERSDRVLSAAFEGRCRAARTS